MPADLDVVTGAFSYTGRFIAERLLALGRPVRTLTRAPAPGHPLAARVDAARLRFDDVDALAADLRGAQTLYNTYWIRFVHGGSTFESAVANTRVLIAAAERAGVERFVQISVSNADERSPLPYFRGKALVERAVRESTLSHAIVRPTLIFGPEDILVNNIAWALRRLPVFLLAGPGDYRVQPVSVTDTAEIAVAAGMSGENVAVDAAGPDVLTFRRLVAEVAGAVKSRARIVPAPPRAALAVAGLVGRLQRDVVLTREELDGLTESLLVSHAPPTGHDRFGDWVAAHGSSLGLRYVSELARNFRPYAPL